MTVDRIKAEHEHIEVARLVAPVSSIMRSRLHAEFALLASKIASVATDDERRELAADMRAVRRMQTWLDGLPQRAEEARQKLEKWSNQ